MIIHHDSYSCFWDARCCFMHLSAILASETSQAYLSTTRISIKRRPSGFNKNEMKAEFRAFGVAQKTAAVHKREFNRAEAYKTGKPSPKGEGSVGKSPTAVAPPNQVPRRRRPTTGDMSAGPKGAEKCSSGNPRKAGHQHRNITLIFMNKQSSVYHVMPADLLYPTQPNVPFIWGLVR